MATKELNLWFMSISGHKMEEKDLSVAIKEFQQKYPDVTLNIERKDIDRNESIEVQRDYYAKLGTTIMSGKGPDIIYMGEMFPQVNDLYKMQQSGAFADLTEFIENDPDIIWENYNQNVIELAKYKEKQYVMPLSYSLPLFMSTREVLDDAGVNENSFTDTQGMMKEITHYWERNDYTPKAPRFFSYSNIFYYFNSLLKLNIADHYEQKSNFESTYTQEVLDFLKKTHTVEMGRVFELEDEGVFYDMFMSLGAARRGLQEKALVTALDRVGLQGYLGNVSALETIGEPIVFPLRDGEGGIQACVMRALMISSVSPNKQNAWNFIKAALSTEQQRVLANNNTDSIPLNRGIWNEMYEEVFTKNFEYQYKGKNFTGKPVEEKYYDQFLQLQEEISGVFFRYPAEKKVIEKLIPYFEGKKSYDEVAKDVQGYLNIYLSE